MLSRLLAGALVAGVLTVGPTTTSTMDCTAHKTACPAVPIAGDAPATLPDGSPSPYRGFADPSIRRDPDSSTLWMAYSWPHIGSDGGVWVDDHLAASTDGGHTWSRTATMWRASSGVDRSGTAGHLNSETVSLAPATDGSRWYSARYEYFTPAGDKPQLTSYTIRIATASAPGGLATAPEETLGGALTDDGWWGADQDLSRADPSLTGCGFLDAGLMFYGGQLNMAVECQLWTGDQEDVADEFVAMFATTPTGPVSSWRWHFTGKLSTHADAVALGDQTLLQADLAIGAGGTPIAILSPSSPGTVLADHDGCRALALDWGAHPALAHDPVTGRPVVLATFTASDEAPTGPGSCGYDPASATGIVIARRTLTGTTMVQDLHATGLHP
jgi:hypothetical protein